MQHFNFRVNLLFVLSIPFTVIDRIDHEQQTDHQPRNNAGEKQVADGCARCHAVHDKRNTRRNNNAKTAGNCYDGSGERQVISKRRQNRDRHTSDSGNGRRSGTGNRTVEKGR